MPPAVPPLELKCTDAAAPLSSRVVCKKKDSVADNQPVFFFIYYLHVIHFMYLALLNVLLIAVLRIVVGET